MATSKPQGNKQGSNKKGGNNVDPLDKWADELDDMRSEGDDSTLDSKKSKKKAADTLQDVLVNNSDKAADSLNKLIHSLSNPRLSSAERRRLSAELLEAKKSFKALTSAADEVAKQLTVDRRLEAQAYAKLNRIRTWKASGDNSGLSPEDLVALNDTEESLKKLITSLSIFNKSDNFKDEDVKKHMVNALDELLDRVDSLPDQWKDAFSSEDSKLDKVLKRQQEARDFVKGQNDAIKKFMWNVADKVGIGAFNIGNIVRTAIAIKNTPKAIKDKYNSITSRVVAAKDYAVKTVQMRKLAKDSVLESPEDPTLHVDFKRKSEKEQKKLIEKYTAATERFRSRMLDKIGKKNKKKEGKEGKEDPSFLDSFKDLFGKGGFIKSLLGMAARVSGVALAGAVGYWVGSKVWEKIAPWVGEKFNNLSGLDEAGRNVTRTVVLNTPDNYSRAKSLTDSLQRPGTKVSGADQDWLADYYKDNSKQADNMSVYSPSANMLARTDRVSTGGLARSDRALDSMYLNQAQAYQGTSSAGQGRGSINPDPVSLDSPTASPASYVSPIQTKPVSTGSQIMSDWMGKTLTKNGSVDVDGINPGMQSNMVNMSKEYFDRTGKKLQLNSGFRSVEKQAELYRTMPKGMAAAPGTSLHNFGLAVDIPSAQTNELRNLGLLEKYGFTRPIAKEPWHVQPVGVSVAAAKAGVYSADGPANQTAMAMSSRPSSQNVASAEPRIPVMSSDGTPVSSGSGGSVGTIGAGNKTSASSVPMFDTSDGLLLAMNNGIL